MSKISRTQVFPDGTLIDLLTVEIVVAIPGNFQKCKIYTYNGHCIEINANARDVARYVSDFRQQHEAEQAEQEAANTREIVRMAADEIEKRRGKNHG